MLIICYTGILSPTYGEKSINYMGAVNRDLYKSLDFKENVPVMHTVYIRGVLLCLDQSIRIPYSF